MSTKSLLYAAITLGACMTFSSTAMADQPEPTDRYSECSSDADCSQGWICEQGPTVTTCSGTTDGGNDDEGCEEYQESWCSPPPPPTCDPAQQSADCSGDDVCVTFTYESCSAPGGGSSEPSNGTTSNDSADSSDGDDDEDDPIDSGSCDTQQESYCVPPYIAPCNVDSDCGPGFACVEEEACEPCAEPARPDGDGDEASGSGSDSNCASTCTPTGQSYCELQEVECTSDADCGAGLECFFGWDGHSDHDDEPGAPTPCETDPDGSIQCDDEGSEGEGSTGGNTGGTDDSGDGGSPIDGDMDDPAFGYCVPTGFDDWGDTYGGVDYADDEDGSTNSGNGGSQTGDFGPGGDWELADAEAARAGANAGGDTDGDSSDSPSGCLGSTVHSAPTGAGAGLLMLLVGLIGWRRRKED